MWRREDLGDSLLMHLEPLRRHLAVWRAAWQMDKLRPRLVPRTADELAFLPAVLEITDSPASPLGRLTAYLVMALFALGLLWASLGEVDIHATAQGRVIPAGKTKAVAPIEIGLGEQYSGEGRRSCFRRAVAGRTECCWPQGRC